MKLLVDMNLAPACCDFLVSEGFEAVHLVHGR
jgi:predicted nuclease of predicted toxin-antitoxin system